MSNIFANYIAREGDLSEFLGNAIQDEIAKNRGWNRYYSDHQAFLDGTGGSNPGVWPSLNQAQKDSFLNFVKGGIKTTIVTQEAAGFTISYPVDVIDTNTSEGKWLAGIIYDLPGGQDAISNWNNLSDSDKETFIDHAAKRRMGFDWHHGIGVFGNTNAPGLGGGSGVERGHRTYSIVDHEPVDGTPVRNEIILSSDGNSFFDSAAVEKAYGTYGQSHWNNYGKNESRALPGSKFSIDGGKITYNKDLVGEGLKENYDNIAKSFNESQGGNYKGLIEGAINSLPDKYQSDIITVDGNNNVTGGDFNTFSAYYLDNKVPKFSASNAAQPPMGSFDPNYYATTNYGKAGLERWNTAQTSVLGFLPDLDVVGGYGVENTNQNIGLFLHGIYTDKKNSGIADKDNRGNAVEETIYSDNYYENWNKIYDDPAANTALQNAIRDDLLGLTQGTASGGLTVEWDEPFVLDEEGNIVYEVDEFGNQTPLINKDAVSYLEGSVFNVFGKKDLEQQDKFQALALDVLKTSMDKLNAERARERELNIFRGLPGFDEVYGANSTIANSIIGDSGIGGFLSMAGMNVDAMTESLEKQLSGVTGISNNSSVYSWQKWFDETLLKRYEELEEVTGKLSADIEGLDPILNRSEWDSFENKVNTIDPETQPEEWNKLMEDNNLAKGLSKERALEIKSPDNWSALLEKYDLSPDLNKEQAIEILTDSENEISRIYTIEDNFRQSFIDDYIKPRFDQSKSMDEFISYLDTLDEDEQNVFQTQDAMQALKNVASAHAAAKLNQIQATPDQYFDANFYFDPTVAIDEREGYEGPRDEDYRKQAERVLADYEAANEDPNSIIEGTKSAAYPNGITWNQYAYYYGVDLKNKDQFARLHYDAIGSVNGYDPAKDVTSVADIKGYIVDTVIPKVSEAKLDLGSAAFSEFTTPEEFADYLLEGIDPTENNPEWKELLEQFGLDTEASLDEVKDYIIDITRTGAAKDIREAIKYLNEKKLKPTQERLGVSYIERDEDANPIDEENTSALFQIFANAGYAGTEDEFFSEFMPDADRGDIAFVGQAMGDGFNLKELSSDPFAALSQVGGMLGSTDQDLFGSGGSSSDEDEEESSYFSLFDDPKDSYSDAGRDYISEYTTFFSS